MPNSVSRCKPSEGVAHCSIVVDRKGNMTLNNLKAQNVTYVDGMPIDAIRINADSRVELGKDKYHLYIDEVLRVSTALLTAQSSESGQQTAYDISYLENVCNTYKKGVEAIQEKQYKINLMNRIPFMFTFVSGAITSISHYFKFPMGVTYFALALTIMGALAFLYGTYRMVKFHNGKEEKKKLTDDFRHDYVCPNCRNFLGNKDFSAIKLNGECPFCHCKWKT